MKGSKEQASIKQFRVTTWERGLLKYLSVRLGLRRYHVLHPSRMYRALDHWWGDQTMGFAQAMAHLRFTSIPTSLVPVGLYLPDQ